MRESDLPEPSLAFLIFSPSPAARICRVRLILSDLAEDDMNWIRALQARKEYCVSAKWPWSQCHVGFGSADIGKAVLGRRDCQRGKQNGIVCSVVRWHTASR